MTPCRAVVLNLLLFGSLVGFDQCGAVHPDLPAEPQTTLQPLRAQPHATPIHVRADAGTRRAALFN